MRKRYYVRKRRRRRKVKARFFILIGLVAVALAVGIYFIVVWAGSEPGTDESPSENATMAPPSEEDIAVTVVTPTPIPTPTLPPTPTPMPTLSPDLLPQQVAATNPENFGFVTEIMDNGEEVDTYNSGVDITFGTGAEYTELEGVTTFRGNNYRDAASFGFADIDVGNETLTLINTKTTGRIDRWGGSGWTGQPLVVKWTGEVLANMDDMLLDDFKGREELTEVIIASLDGNIYFMELSTGTKTRNPVFSGGPVKGTPSLDPRGYPIIYVGQGLTPSGSINSSASIYFRAFSLIDGERIMRVGASTADPFALRGWQAYDSSPLIDAETDTLIWPGENGVIYVCKLNTQYDAAAGTVSMDMDPEKVKYRYTSTRNDAMKRWGIENSIVTWRNYMIFTDNAGMLQCVNLNTMELVYANDLSDDSDVSMVLEEDVVAATFYLYTGCEYDELVRPLGRSGPAYARKIDGLTGEILWQTEFTVIATDSVDGGILASPVLGKDGTTMEGLIIYNVTYEVKGDSSTSRLVALDKMTGDIVWEYDMDAAGWSPSSPVPVYTEDGQGYIVQCDIDGDVALIRVDGQTASEAAKLNVEDNFEATPVVYENMIVVGSRDDHFFYIEIG
ncbi:MAG: pyrrolo-quinoline quinone [Clostridia bacterium]|jgi:outer membrane protein assembly factor BamB|nr:pyrrolo-quinoline quinone [Clostridia bacterium]MBT7121467.1 pyrrolo-quinoline quinone [Clostridia bacterium]